MQSWKHVLVALALGLLAACQPQPQPGERDGSVTRFDRID
jgi:hypothetical protein